MLGIQVLVLLATNAGLVLAKEIVIVNFEVKENITNTDTTKMHSIETTPKAITKKVNNLVKMYEVGKNQIYSDQSLSESGNKISPITPTLVRTVENKASKPVNITNMHADIESGSNYLKNSTNDSKITGNFTTINKDEGDESSVPRSMAKIDDVSLRKPNHHPTKHISQKEVARLKRGYGQGHSSMLSILNQNHGFNGGNGQKYSSNYGNLQLSNGGGSSSLASLLGGHNFLSSVNKNHYGIMSGTDHSSASSIAQKAAGQATAAEASQSHAAYKAAQSASRKIAAQVSVAAQKAQAAAALKYSQASQLTQAAQIAQALVFREASQAAKTGRTVQAAEAVKATALSQFAALKDALAQAEAQIAIADQVLSAASGAYRHQAQNLQHAQRTAHVITHHQSKAIAELSSAQTAAEKARAAATKALYKAHSAASSVH